MAMNVDEHSGHLSKTCAILNITTTNGIWPSRNPLIESIPLLIMQLAFVIFVTRSLYFILRPLHQPRLVTDVLGGLLLGPSLFGKESHFSRLFPLRTIVTLETVAYMALDLYIFLIGLGMDINSIKRSSKRELNVAVAAALIPGCIGAGLFFLTAGLLNLRIDPNGCFFWGLTLTVTGFPAVTQILEELKLLHSDIGSLATSIALLSDVCSWILVTVVLPIRLIPKNAPTAIISTLAFILICVYVVRPGLAKIIRCTSVANNNAYSDYYLCFVLIGVMICSFVTEVTGTYSIVGAFVFGVIMPDKELGDLLIDRFADFVSGIMLPLFFAVCGIRANVQLVQNWFLAGFVIIMTCLCKISSTLLVSCFYQMPFQDGFALGVLMNSKGILAVVVLNLGLDKKILHEQEYAVMVIAMVIMTGGVAPILAAIYGSSERQIQYQGRSIQCTEKGAELRVLACVPTVDNVAGTINLLNLCNATKQSPLCIFALQLVELRGGASAMLIVHATGKNSISPYNNRVGNSSDDEIINEFEAFENENTGITVHPMTALSPFISMHEDVCALAEDKHVAFMIIPFQSKPTVDDHMDDEEFTVSSSFREVNLNILANAPCSVGIFVDKGLHKPCSRVVTQHVVMVFIGGPDDREALAFAWRMLENPLVILTVLRIHSRPDTKDSQSHHYHHQHPQFLDERESHRYHHQHPQFIDERQSHHYHHQHPQLNDERQSQLDAECVNEFRLQTAGELNVNYCEKIVNDGDETVDTLNEMEVQREVDLYIVGREATETKATASLLDWSDSMEIGGIGDYLVSSEKIRGSVLVVQHYRGDAGDLAPAAAIRGFNRGLLL